MTAHELARVLLKGPDVKVMLVDWVENHFPPKELEEKHIKYPFVHATYVRDEMRPGYWHSVLHKLEAVGLGVGL